MLTIAIEASHLFRAGDQFQTQFFVMDVANYIKRTFFDDTDDFSVVVLHGSTKEEQGDRYASALERFAVKVIRMRPIASVTGDNRVYYKPTYYLHKMMGTDIAKGSSLVLVGFHNPRYLSFLQKYHTDYELSMAAFGTPSKQGTMQIPEEFKTYLKHMIYLDEHVQGIKSEFKRKK